MMSVIFTAPYKSLKRQDIQLGKLPLSVNDLVYVEWIKRENTNSHDSKQSEDKAE